MRIQSVLGNLGLGGHIASALSHAKYLKEMGHESYFIAPSGSSHEMEQEFAEAGIPVQFFRKRRARYNFPSSRGATAIENACRENKIDVIVAHDTAHLGASYKAAVKLRKGMLYCRAGGPVTYSVLPQNMNIVFYSQELLDGMAEKCHLNRERISVIRARIDTSTYKPEPVSPTFIERYNLPKTGRKIVTAIRLHNEKRAWLKNLLGFAETFGGKIADVHLVIAGGGDLSEEVSARAAEINRRHNRQVVYLTGPISNLKDLNQLYNYADIVAGNGRGILEAMACGKCVVNLGENAEAAVVGPRNVEDIAWYNFSGRHFRYIEGHKDSIHICLEHVLADRAHLDSAGRFSLRYIQEHMDARIGAREISAILTKTVTCRHRYRDYYTWYLKAIAARLMASERLWPRRRYTRRRKCSI